MEQAPSELAAATRTGTRVPRGLVGWLICLVAQAVEQSVTHTSMLNEKMAKLGELLTGRSEVMHTQ